MHERAVRELALLDGTTHSARWVADVPLMQAPRVVVLACARSDLTEARGAWLSSLYEQPAWSFSATNWKVGVGPCVSSARSARPGLSLVETNSLSCRIRSSGYLLTGGFMPDHQSGS